MQNLILFFLISNYSVDGVNVRAVLVSRCRKMCVQMSVLLELIDVTPSVPC